MQYGTSVEVIYPTELRTQIGEAVKEMNNRYNN
jgi:predicted DNA-binding transcriptional regulator YafY